MGDPCNRAKPRVLYTEWPRPPQDFQLFAAGTRGSGVGSLTFPVSFANPQAGWRRPGVQIQRHYSGCVSRPNRTAARPSLVVAALLLGLQALAVFGFALVQFTGAQVAASIAGVGILMLAYGIFLSLVARGVLLGRRWSRGPAIAMQLLALPIAWGLRQGPSRPVAAALALSAAAIVICLLLPSSTAVFVPEADRDPERS